MRRLIGAASRRTAGLAAGLILTGGVAGGVLLAPGAAYADTGATVAITGATQEPGFDGGGAMLDVGVSVQPAPTSPAWVAVTGAGSGCTAMVGASGTGDCSVRDVAAGTYTLTASYGGSTSAGFPVTVTGTPSTPPPNPYRHRQHHNEFVDLSTDLSCTSPVHTGQRGHCTLDVTNSGQNSAPDVTAQIALPYQLRADYCGYSNWFGYGCSISGNTASENLGTLSAGQTRELTVTFTADTGFSLWGRHHGHRFTATVDGSASSFGNSGNFGDYSYYGQRESSSTAYVTVIPRGLWW
jgi:Domain of unknown function DUF11